MVVNFGVFFAAFGISLLALSEAGAVTAIYQGIYRGFRPVLYALAGVLLVLVPTFTVGRYIVYLPLDYVLAASAVILFYFGYRLLRSARRYFKRAVKGGGGEEERGDLAVVFTVSAIEAFEAALVLIALIPRSYASALVGTLIASAIVIVLTALIKDQIARIRLPHLKYVLSSLLFSLGTLWAMEAVDLDVTDLVLIPLFLTYLGINYLLIKV
jgi:Predicted membrane protein